MARNQLPLYRDFAFHAAPLALTDAAALETRAVTIRLRVVPLDPVGNLAPEEGILGACCTLAVFSSFFLPG
jgi:hypothetical protein